MAKKKQNGYATKNDLEGAVEAILMGMDEMVGKIDRRFDRAEKELGGVNKRLDKVETAVKFLREDMKDIKAEFSTTVSKREFNEFRRKALLS